MSENKKDIENLWDLADVTTLPKENTYVIEDNDGKKDTLEYKDSNWIATNVNSSDTYTLTKTDSGYNLQDTQDGTVFSHTTLNVKREGEGTGYYQDPDPRISYNLDELKRQAETNKKNGQTVTDFRIYTEGDPTQPKTLRMEAKLTYVAWLFRFLEQGLFHLLNHQNQGRI